MGNPSTDPFDLARAEAMLRGYDARWAGESYEVLAVECEFAAPLVNPGTGAASRTWTLAGKIDAVVREITTRRVLIVEHKTASGDIGPGSEYWKRLRMDGQVSVYYEGARSLGFTVDGCLYDVLGKVALRPYEPSKKRSEPESPEEFRLRCIEAVAAEPMRYFQRGEVVRLESEMADALFDVWQLGQALRESERAGRFPRNPDACVRYGRTCEFFGPCTGEASLEDPALFRRSEAIHPELSTNADQRLLSASRMRDARACQRLHKYKYLDGYRPAQDADALRFGSLMHLALEAWWRAPEGERLEAALAALNPSTPSISMEVACQ